MRKRIRIVSSGGGQQSTALLVARAMGLIDYDYFVMSNVGNDSENPATIAYTEEVAIPYAKKHGIPFVVLSDENNTLLQKITGEKNRGYMIPAYFVGRKGDTCAGIVNALLSRK